MSWIVSPFRVLGRFTLRLISLLWDVTKSTGGFLLRTAWGWFRQLILEELVWKWWLGYGERPLRVLTVIGLILVATWLLYWLAGTFVLDAPRHSYITGCPSYQDALYYSLISFSALGYGSWAIEPTGWAKWVGAVQPFFGIISAVALSINLTQRMGR